jgi:hypothetical protein
METTQKKDSSEFLCECGELLEWEKLKKFSLRTGCHNYNLAVACTKCRAIYFSGGIRACHRNEEKAFLKE